jgi:hypothetical protein
MSLFDRVAAGLETLGKKANQALDEGKLRVELARVRRRMDNAARDLGYLTYRQAKGTAAAPGDVESLTRRIAEAETTAARLEADIEQVKQRGKGAAAAAGAAEAPPATAEPANENEPAATEAASPSSPGEPPPGP